MADLDETTWFEDAPVSVPRLRLIWAAVTAHPDWSLRQLACATTIPLGAISRGLCYLEAAGYIQWSRHKCRTIQVLVPFTAPYAQMPRIDGRTRLDVANPANWELSV